ncbi:MAG: AAA family ATPase [Bacteroidota bacterium]
MESENPFLIRGYNGPRLFCDRENETNRIVEALSSNRNLTLISLRRMGKTGLIHHSFYHLNKRKQAFCFYIDIMPTAGLNELIQLLGKEVLGKLDSTPEKLIKKIGTFFTALKPSVKYDSLTGEPSVEFTLNNSREAQHTIEQIFQYLDSQDRKIVVAIDEFQQIVNYPEKNVESLLRANVQRCKNVNFIFSGSQKKLLISMFSNHGKPFYQSSEIINLESIEKNKYKSFIQKHFAEGKQKIVDESVELILKFARGHTWYVQYACNKIYAKRLKIITPETTYGILIEILKENEVVYYNYRNLLTDNQWQLLKAIAKEGQIKKITSKDFIHKHKIGAASSIKTALTTLIDKEMIFSDQNGNYFVYDVFLSRWLEMM